MPLFNEQQQGNPILLSQKYRIPLLFYKEKHEHYHQRCFRLVEMESSSCYVTLSLTTLCTQVFFCAILACFRQKRKNVHKYYTCICFICVYV